MCPTMLAMMVVVAMLMLEVFYNTVSGGALRVICVVLVILQGPRPTHEAKDLQRMRCVFEHFRQ